MLGSWNGSPWDALPWNGSDSGGAVAPEVFDSWFAGMRARLMSLPALSGLTDIYKNHAARGWVEPIIVITPITSSDQIFNTESYWRTSQYQFSVIASDDLIASAIGESAYQALLPINKSKYPPILFDGGYEIVRWPLYANRIIEQPMRTAGNKNLWMYTFGYEIQTGHEG